MAFKSGNKFGCELYISTDSKEKNEEIFDLMLGQKDELEQELGPLSWERLDHRKACRIAKLNDITSYDDNNVEALKKWALEYLQKFRRVFGEKVRGL